MNKLRFLAFSTTAFVFSTSVLLACSEDTVVVVPGEDSGLDAGSDAASPDSGRDADTGTDAKVDSGLTVTSYNAKVADTLCRSISRCCFGSPTVPDGSAVDGGTYNPSACLSLQSQLGFEYSNVGADVPDAGVTLDDAKALDCLAKIEALSCSLTGTELRAARAVCFDALNGTQAIGQPCSVSVECATGFCKPTDAAAGGAGTCQPLATVDGSCGDAFASGVDDEDQRVAEEVCSTRGGGDTALHCNSYDYTNGVYRDRVEWKCVAGVADGEGCSATSWCATGICDKSDYICKDPLAQLAQSCPLLVVTP